MFVSCHELWVLAVAHSANGTTMRLEIIVTNSITAAVRATLIDSIMLTSVNSVARGHVLHLQSVHLTSIRKKNAKLSVNQKEAMLVNGPVTAMVILLYNLFISI